MQNQPLNQKSKPAFKLTASDEEKTIDKQE